MSVGWQETTVAPAQTHHLARGSALYEARFTEVLSFHDPGLAAARDDSGAFHIHMTGRPAYARRFSRTFGFYEGRAAVEEATGAHPIDVQGNDLSSDRFAWCGNFQGGRAAVRAGDGSYLHITLEGRPAYDARFRYVGDYREGTAVALDRDGLHVPIDIHGQALGGQRFLDLDVFHKGFARARDARGWFHLRRDGQPAYERRFAAVEPFYNGKARVEEGDGGLLIIDESGCEVVRLREPRTSALAALSADMVGFWRTQAIATAVRVRLPEALPATESDVAARCDMPASSAGRLLRALGELRVVERSDEVFQLTAKGMALREESEMTLRDAALEYAGPFTKRWERLEEALRSSVGWEPASLFDEVASDAKRSRTHHRTLASYARHDYGPVANAFDGRLHRTLLDAGGGQGVLITEILRRHTHMTATLLERAEVIATANIPEDVRPRVTLLEGDFFEVWPARADAILLARVLHDWDDRAAEAILTRAHEAIEPNGRLYIAEMVLDPQSFDGGLCDLHLLAVMGGRERNACEFSRLLEKAGFRVVDVHALASVVSLVIAEPR